VPPNDFPAGNPDLTQPALRRRLSGFRPSH
jgi:hypothetical protein